MDGLIIAAIIVLALLGTPLFAVFGGAAVLLFAQLEDTSITGAANDVFSEKFADSPLLVTIPLFTFAGYLMAESGTPRRLVEVSRAWLGWLPGGLAIVCLVASAFFTTFTGGSGITIVAIGGLLYPALIADKYSERFSLGLITTGGSLGLLFPPSLPIVLYGVVAGVLIEKLFLAGIIPGFITVLALAGYAVSVGIRSPLPRTAFDARSAFGTLWYAKWEVLLPIVLLGGMYSGLLRIHEAAAFTAIYVLIIEVFVYRDVTFRHDLPRIIRESMTLVGAILAILATAIGFTAYLIQAQVPMQILEAMETLISSELMFLLVLNVFLLGVGMLMDIFSAIVVVVPLIVPIANHFGIDPYHLGIVFLLNLEIGYMTPPVGLNLFISSFRFGKPVTLLYRAVLPFIGLLVVALVLITYIPQLSTWATGLIESEGLVRPEGAAAEMPAAEDTDEASDLELEPVEEGEGADDLTLEDLEGDDGADDLTLEDLEGDDGELDLDDLEGLDEDDGSASDDGDDGDDGELDLDELMEQEGL
ncbi:MAG: TRAP transporter large permease [Myxococcota bacterium]